MRVDERVSQPHLFWGRFRIYWSPSTPGALASAPDIPRMHPGFAKRRSPHANSSRGPFELSDLQLELARNPILKLAIIDYHEAPPRQS